MFLRNTGGHSRNTEEIPKYWSNISPYFFKNRVISGNNSEKYNYTYLYHNSMRLEII